VIENGDLMAKHGLMRLLHLRGYPILSQLRLEEALYRAHSGSWMLINEPPPEKTIVLGISG